MKIFPFFRLICKTTRKIKNMIFLMDQLNPKHYKIVQLSFFNWNKISSKKVVHQQGKEIKKHIIVKPIQKCMFLNHIIYTN